MAIKRSQLKSKRGRNFLPHRDLNLGPLAPKASVLPMIYNDLNTVLLLAFIYIHHIVNQAACSVAADICFFKNAKAGELVRGMNPQK